MDELERSICSSIPLELDSQQCITKGIRWLVAFTDPMQTWENEPTYLFIQFSVFLGVLLNFIHACKNGGRYYHFWWATIVVSLVTECACYLMPNIDNFWHAQGIISLFGKRFPLYIVFVYNQFWYTAWITVSRARLRWWAEPFAVGLLVVMLDLPYDIMGIKMLWWTWHDTDANIFDRHYFVPWTSYYFHSAFVSALILVFFGTRKLLMPSKGKLESGNCILEWLCTILAGSLAMPLGAALFMMLFYHPLHDWFDIHSEVPVLMWLAMCAVITWMADRAPSAQARTAFNTGNLVSIPVFNVLQHFMLFVGLMFVAKPEEVKSTGIHQEIGPCNETEETFSISGTTILRRKYFCPTDYNEPVGFHCLPDGKPPADGESWYTFCGLPFENAMEYKLIVWFCCAMGLVVFMQFLLFSGDQQQVPSPGGRTSHEVPRNTNKKQQNKKKKAHKE